MSDPFALQRFVEAQAPVFDQALEELRQGHKRSHWMWFVFPQLKGLGRSPTSQRYAITGAAEARAYALHPLLGPRLVAVTQAVLDQPGRTPREIFGQPDDLKLHSSLTLFANVNPDQPLFRQALVLHYQGVEDPRTLFLLGD